VDQLFAITNVGNCNVLLVPLFSWTMPLWNENPENARTKRKRVSFDVSGSLDSASCWYKPECGAVQQNKQAKSGGSYFASLTETALCFVGKPRFIDLKEKLG
jgi:hypothetical protein